MSPNAIEAGWWRVERSGDSSAARCGLCRHECLIRTGGGGRCGVRFFAQSEGFSSPYLGRFISAAIDPIEKKPLHHWRPGTRIMSLGGVGCNMVCPFCQNHHISHPARMPSPDELSEITPEALVRLTVDAGLSSVAYTYNEPTMQVEYILAASPVLEENGIASVLVTNGMFSEALCGEMSGAISAANVDVKTFDPETYRALGGKLEAVKSNVERLATGGVHVELTNLIVPGVSDSMEDFVRLVEWIEGISREIPLHISRYFPSFRCNAPPTDVALMRKFSAHASAHLKHVHLGNV
ncbi:MAG: radical SAM protein [Synergistaceae bacterium]|jgi:pyruvate formate lyase activating enzyme|nr:radical SAM protein [Synergistaceae bacterium]